MTEQRASVREHRRCYATLVMKDLNYAKGAIVLAIAMRATGARYPLVCMVTPDVSDPVVELLRAHFDVVTTVPYLEYSTRPLVTDYQKKLYGGWMHFGYTRFNAIGLAGFDKVVILDADLLPVKSFDSLFDVPAPAGIFNRSYNVSPYLFKHGERVPDARARCTGWRGPYKGQSPGGSDRNTVSGEVLVLDCSASTFAKYREWMSKQRNFGAEDTDLPRDRVCLSGWDEVSIGRFYVEVMGKSWTNISQGYAHKAWNAVYKGVPVMASSFMGDKPWNATKQWDDFAGWWKVVKDAGLTELFAQDFNKLTIQRPAQPTFEKLVVHFDPPGHKTDRHRKRERAAIEASPVTQRVREVDAYVSHTIRGLPYQLAVSVPSSRGGTRLEDPFTPTPSDALQEVVQETLDKLWRRVVRIYIVPPVLFGALVYDKLVDAATPDSGYLHLRCVPSGAAGTPAAPEMATFTLTEDWVSLVRRYFVMRTTLATERCLLLNGELYHIPALPDGDALSQTAATLAAVMPHVVGDRRGTVARMMRHSPVRLKLDIDMDGLSV